jgi:hypothetical protein
MRTLYLLALVCLICTALTDDCRAQFGRPPPVAPAPHVAPHVPGAQGGGGGGGDPMPIIIGLLVVVGLAVGIGLVVRSLRQRAAGRIRIVAVPPGEAPQGIRQAWVGVELPLVAGQKQPQASAVHGVMSGGLAGSALAYVVDGRTAVERLASHDPNAADWWRENAPHVLAAGYQLLFPADVCQPIDQTAA